MACHLKNANINLLAKIFANMQFRYFQLRLWPAKGVPNVPEIIGFSSKFNTVGWQLQNCLVIQLLKSLNHLDMKYPNIFVIS